jgi:hypothetical protein
VLHGVVQQSFSEQSAQTEALYEQMHKVRASDGVILRRWF